jgi:hypothetical protein
MHAPEAACAPPPPPINQMEPGISYNTKQLGLPNHLAGNTLLLPVEYMAELPLVVHGILLHHYSSP